MNFLLKQWHRIKHSFAAGKLNRLSRHWSLKIILPFLIVAYFGLLDFFDELEWIAKYKEYHLKAFFFILVLELGVRILDYVRERCEEVVTDKHRSVLTELLVSVSVIVQTKVTRFREALPRIGTKSPFDVITKPDEQINVIGMRIGDYLKSFGAVPEDCFDVTVMRSTDDETWDYEFKLQKNFSRPQASRLMDRTVTSTARFAFESGNEQFFASKFTASQDGKYHLGERDKLKGDGSIYCKPVKIDLPDRTENYVITLTTYGTTLCHPLDVPSTDVWTMICREFARRIELELVLLSMKEWKARDSELKRVNRTTKKK